MAICYRLQHKTVLVTAAVASAIAITVAVVAGEQMAVSREILYWVVQLYESFGAEQTTIPLICPLAADLVRGDAQCPLFSWYAIHGAIITHPNVSMCRRLSCNPGCTS
ncbi:hypothetical protein PG996_001096 [Apiospora saccharicola]|uniref:Uncharacterized protein n=1 Tax=Apiospora saccharicola TaxID=335842 RepID=A0ABR1WFM8_9PEZI